MNRLNIRITGKITMAEALEIEEIFESKPELKNKLKFQITNEDLTSIDGLEIASKKSRSKKKTRISTSSKRSKDQATSSQNEPPKVPEVPKIWYLLWADDMGLDKEYEDMEKDEFKKMAEEKFEEQSWAVKEEYMDRAEELQQIYNDACDEYEEWQSAQKRARRDDTISDSEGDSEGSSILEEEDDDLTKLCELCYNAPKPRKIIIRDNNAREAHLAICPNARDKRRDMDWCKENFNRRTYRCPVEACLKLYFSKELCNNHRIQAHGHEIFTRDGERVEPMKVKCKKRGCNQVYANKDSMMKHYRQKHEKK